MSTKKNQRDLWLWSGIIISSVLTSPANTLDISAMTPAQLQLAIDQAVHSVLTSPANILDTSATTPEQLQLAIDQATKKHSDILEEMDASGDISVDLLGKSLKLTNLINDLLALQKEQERLKVRPGTLPPGAPKTPGERLPGAPKTPGERLPGSEQGFFSSCWTSIRSSLSSCSWTSIRSSLSSCSWTWVPICLTVVYCTERLVGATKQLVGAIQKIEACKKTR